MASAFMNMTFLRSCMVSVTTTRGEVAAGGASRATRCAGTTPRVSPPAAMAARGDRAHQADVAGAVDEAEARPGQRRAELGGGGGVGRVAAGARAAEHAHRSARGQDAWTGS